MDRMPAARRALHSVGYQQSSLRNAQGHHGRQEKGDHNRYPRIAWRKDRAHSESRKDLRAGKDQENRIPVWPAKGSRSEACRKTEIRSTGDLTLKNLGITEQRQGKWNNTSFETLAAAQQIAAAASDSVSAAVLGKGIDALATELAAKNVAEVFQVEHDLLENYTPDGFCVALRQVIESQKPDLVL